MKLDVLSQPVARAASPYIPADRALACAAKRSQTLRTIRPLLALLLTFGMESALPAASSQILGWNNLGMHCMDSDYSVFSVLPPYNTIHAQLMVNGKLVTNGAGYTVTYQAVSDPNGSVNSTAAGKTSFYDYSEALFGVALPMDSGLPVPGPDAFLMPGKDNTPQEMLFETNLNWFAAYGIPITPYDDAGKKNPYPLMRVIARNSQGTAIATNDIVLPVSDEMDCRMCHASGTQPQAEPAQGWVWNEHPERDYRLNILRLHDENNFATHRDLYVAALEARGFNPQGLYRGVVADHQPVLCAACHASEALGTGSFSTIPALTASVHAKHAGVTDPLLGITLDNSDHRAACYRCHPGSTTKCLRGAMGGAVASDGTLEMQCQSCHGSMSQVGAANRIGWLMEPNCQSCHTGTALSNSGQIRYTSSFTGSGGTVRIPANRTFATSDDTPAPGLSLYRFSTGHGGLQCSACHGSTHAEFPATHRNDNLRNEQIQGHAGVMIECTACHTSMAANAANASGGPHGMHPVGQVWVAAHPGLIDTGSISRGQCRSCHGVDYTGTVLSRAQANRRISSDYGTKNYWRGQQVGCYDCHNGPSSESPTSNTPATVGTITTNTLSNGAVSVILPAIDPNGDPLSFRIVSQPTHGAVGLTNNVATYFAEEGFVGQATFTFAAFDTRAESNLGTGIVSIAQGPFGITAKALVPPSYPANWPVPFGIVPAVSNLQAGAAVVWNFGDGSPASTKPFTAHRYSQPGTYQWSVTTLVQDGATTVSPNLSGTIEIGPPVALNASVSGGAITLAWPHTTADALLEETASLAPGAVWRPCTNAVTPGATLKVTVSGSGTKFYRLRRP